MATRKTPTSLPTRDDVLTHADTGADTFDPVESLPPHLRDSSLHQDLLKRTKDRARRYGLLWLPISKEPIEGSDVREALHTMASVASEREAELRLYHQSRVFQQVLGRAVNAIGTFVSEPLPIVPRTWRKAVASKTHPTNVQPKKDADTKESDSEEPSSESASTAEDTPPKPLANEVFRKFVIATVTPKWILLAATAILLTATGINQWRIVAKDQMIAQYEASAKRADDTKRELELSIQTHGEEIAQSRRESGDQRHRATTAEQKASELTADLAAAEERASILEDRLSQQAEDDTEADKQISEIQDELQEAKTSLATVKAQLLASQSRNKELISNTSKQDEVIAKFQQQQGAVQIDLSRIRIQTASLQRKASMFYYSEKLAESVRRQTKWHSNPDKKALLESLKDYDSARKNHIDSQ